MNLFANNKINLHLRKVKFMRTGENGAGKSRANDMCLGLLEPTSGEINGVNGQDCQSRFTIKAANGNRNGSVLYVDEAFTVAQNIILSGKIN